MRKSFVFPFCHTVHAYDEPSQQDSGSIMLLKTQMWNPSQHSLTHWGNGIVGFIPQCISFPDTLPGWWISPLCLTSLSVPHFTMSISMPYTLNGPWLLELSLRMGGWIAKLPISLPLYLTLSTKFIIISDRVQLINENVFIVKDSLISECKWLKGQWYPTLT